MDYDKVSAGLAAAYHRLRVDDRRGLGTLSRRLGLVGVVESSKPPRAVVFARLTDPAAARRLGKLGATLNSGYGRLRTGVVELAALPELTSVAGLERLEVARPLHPLMDVAPGRVHVPDLVRRTGTSGRGVVVGVIDTGIDAGHPAFAGRVHRIWDQTVRGDGVAEGGYGVELCAAELGRSGDTHGHGTHVAGIAAGADDRYPGIAPGATLVVVRTTLLDAHIADGVRYCFRVAAELGLPAVVNLSLGGHADPHDGTDPLSQTIDAACGPGRIVVCAAGNEGEDAIHAQLAMPAHGTRTVTFTATHPVELNLWYPGVDECEASVAGPSGAATPWQPVLAGRSPVGTYPLPDGTVELITPGPDPVNGDHHVLASVTPRPGGRPAAPRPGAIWRLRLRARRVSAGRVDVWLLSDADRSEAFTGRCVADSTKVGSPGAAGSALTVAAYTTRNTWTDVDGVRRDALFPVDELCSFSSPGPRRDGVGKPDLTAPGAMLVSALSGLADLDRSFRVDARHAALAGTSMAAPFVAGLVALLLQRDPTLTPDAVRAALRSASSLPAGHAEYDPRWGYGLIDAAKL